MTIKLFSGQNNPIPAVVFKTLALGCRENVIQTKIKLIICRGGSFNRWLCKFSCFHHLLVQSQLFATAPSSFEWVYTGDQAMPTTIRKQRKNVILTKIKLILCWGASFNRWLCRFSCFQHPFCATTNFSQLPLLHKGVFTLAITKRQQQLWNREKMPF